MKKKLLAVVIAAAVLGSTLTGCRESQRVSYNLGKSADAFNITRQITVFNTRTDTVLFQMTGKMSLSDNTSNELEVIVEDSEGSYKKHFIYLSQDSTYIVEDVTGTFSDPYHYELNILPEMGQFVTVTSEY